MSASITMNSRQKAIYEKALTGANMWIIGPPGVGKSFVITHIVEGLEASGKDVAVTAYTGTAAGLLKGGETLHRFTRVGTESLKMHKFEFVLSADGLTPQQHRVLNSIGTLIIDEAGMLGVDQIHHLDLFLKRIRRGPAHRSRPFGGMQIILVGDIAQLPPCDTNEGAGSKRDIIVPVESVFEYPDVSRWCPMSLTDFVRSAEDPKLQEIMMALIDVSQWKRRLAIRLINKLCYKEDEYSRETAIQLAESRGALILTPTNNQVDYYNRVEEAINKDKPKVNLPRPTRLYDPSKLTKEQIENCGGIAGVEREDKEIRDRKTFSPVPQFHIGQQVQARRNGDDGANTYNNGDICTIVSYAEETDTLTLRRTRDGVILSVTQCDHKTEYEADVGNIGYRAHPIVPATATTIHKAQGQTLPSVVMDPYNIGLFGKNVPNLLYVAVSRVRKLPDFILVAPIPEEAIDTESVQTYLSNMRSLDFMEDYPEADMSRLEAWLSE